MELKTNVYKFFIISKYVIERKLISFEIVLNLHREYLK